MIIALSITLDDDANNHTIITSFQRAVDEATHELRQRLNSDVLKIDHSIQLHDVPDALDAQIYRSE